MLDARRGSILSSFEKEISYVRTCHPSPTLASKQRSGRATMSKPEHLVVHTPPHLGRPIVPSSSRFMDRITTKQHVAWVSLILETLADLLTQSKIELMAEPQGLKFRASVMYADVFCQGDAVGHMSPHHLMLLNPLHLNRIKFYRWNCNQHEGLHRFAQTRPCGPRRPTWVKELLMERSGAQDREDSHKVPGNLNEVSNRLGNRVSQVKNSFLIRSLESR